MSEKLVLKAKIEQLYSELSLLCDEDYYNACDLIEQLEMQLEKVSDKE